MRVLQEYKEFYDDSRAAVDAEMSELSASESRWIDHWHDVVDKLKLLYS